MRNINWRKLVPGARRRPRNRKKFIPDSDSDFACMARNFADGIARDPQRYFLSQEQSAEISEAVSAFRAALCISMQRYSRTLKSIDTKDRARARAETVVRKYAKLIRANEAIGTADKLAIHVKDRADRLTRRTCPMTPPQIDFVGVSAKDGPIGAKHVLKFMQWMESGTRAKPAGAARLELFVELVAPGEPVPTHPGELSGGRPWYLRSYTRSPAQVQFPMPNTPMLVVYWGRWADSTGNVGPWSAAVPARVEGWASGTALMNATMRVTVQQIDMVRHRRVQYIEQDEALRMLPPADDAGQISIRQLEAPAAEKRQARLLEQSPAKQLPEVA